MNWSAFKSVPVWSVAVPVAACVILAVAGGSAGWLVLACAGAALIGSVVAAVHHAEVIAHRVGEPFGTLVLALAVTIIEVSLIVSVMRSNGGATAALARDTVFATVMIICNGVVGLCLLVGGCGITWSPPESREPRRRWRCWPLRRHWRWFCRR
jgi:Ca2+:H+ antiporter